MNKFKLLVIDKDIYFRNTSIQFGKNTILLKLYSTNRYNNQYFRYYSTYSILNRKLFNGKSSNCILNSIKNYRRYMFNNEYSKKYVEENKKFKNIFEVATRENINFFSNDSKELKLTY